MAHRQHFHQRGRSNDYGRSDRSASQSPSTTTPSKWHDVAADQAGSFDRPGSPRVDRREGYARRGNGSWDGRGTDDERVSTPGARYTVSIDHGDAIRGRQDRQKWVTSSWDPATPVHDIKQLGAQEATFRSENNDRGIGYRGATTHTRPSGADAPVDRDSTWEQCGLSVDTTSENKGPLADRDMRNGSWVDPIHNINNNPTAPPPFRQTSAWHQKGDVHAPSGQPGKPPRNPDNYDGNRAGLDGSRVFYAAIIPAVPVLEDIANHAEYVAWIDKLRSTLRYHQLTPVIARDANRPHGPVAAKRWDQDRLRAALIVKGALGYKAFEMVGKQGWEDTEDPAGTLAKIRAAHGAACPCSQPPHGMTLLDL